MIARQRRTSAILRGMKLHVGLVLVPLVSLSWLPACSDDGVPSTGDGSATDGGGESATDPTSALDTGPGSTGGSASASQGDATGPNDTTAAPGSTGGSSSDTGVDATGTGDTSSGTTGEPPTSCVDAGDCVLWEDCCSCVALLDGVAPPACDVDACDQTACAALGFDPAVQCELESCEFVPVPCNPADIMCDDDPPACDPDTFPGVDPNMGCWTGTCVPVEACDVVPSCADCPADEACVEFISQLPQVECVPLPADCGGQASCGCLGELCVDPFDLCGEQDGALTCACIEC